LGVNLSTQERTTRNFDQFKLTQSCWWNNSIIDGAVESLEITTADAFATGAALKPDAARIWQEKLAKITHDRIDEIFAKIPNELGIDRNSHHANALDDVRGLIHSIRLELVALDLFPMTAPAIASH
jgi:hypothetical protein